MTAAPYPDKILAMDCASIPAARSPPAAGRRRGNVHADSDLVVRGRRRASTFAHRLRSAIAVDCGGHARRDQPSLYIVTLQDRIIRVEMHGRLSRLGRDRDFGRLSIKQITALRFASDAELPALLDKTLAENLTPDQIKRAVVNWQADHYRT